MGRRIFETVAALALVVVLAACGGDGAASSDIPDTATSDPAVATFEEWCSVESIERCVEGFYMLYDDPEAEACVVASDPQTPLNDSCTARVDVGTPVTTIPAPGSEQEAEAEAERRRDQLRADRASLSVDLSGLLAATHPGERVEVALVATESVTLDEADGLVAGFGGDFERAWRTDYVCLEGEGIPTQGPTRVADRHGIARAEQLRRQADESDEPVTGYFILSDAWARMAQSQVALELPGVLIEALTASVPVEALDTILADPAFSEVWIGLVDEGLLELSDPVRPECPDRP